MKRRLDVTVTQQGLVPTRSQAESYIRLGKVTVNGRSIKKTGFLVGPDDDIAVAGGERYVSRAGLKLASVAKALQLDFNHKIVLDVGSSTGGFTDYALQHGAEKVIAVDVGTDQLHPMLLGHPRIELHEKTDIRTFVPGDVPDIVVLDVSFISLREVLPAVARFVGPQTDIVAMVKPQFEAGAAGIKHNGVIKNDRLRRTVLHGFELWSRRGFVIIQKSDSSVAGAKGNLERFYLLRKVLPA